MSLPGYPKFRAAGAAVIASLICVAGGARADDSAGQPRSLAQAIALERADALPRTPFYDPPRLAGTSPGDLLREAVFDGYAVPDGVRAIRILYHSLDADGHDVATSAVVLIPAGRVPAGGWPVIAWAHGTSGVARQCAPSLQKDLEYGELGLMPMVRAGFAVVATDYHGLGTPGPHEYVNKIAQARDVIYAVPAARKAEPSLGRKWTAVGHSEGGVAVWGVAELEATARDPGYLGAVSVAGVGDLKTALERMAVSGDAAAFYLAYMAFAIHARSPEFRADQMLDGHALERYRAATTRGCWYYAYASFLGTHDGRVLKKGWEDQPAVHRFLDENRMGEVPTARPLLVVAGEADRAVPFASLKETVARACASGHVLTLWTYPGLDHSETLRQATPDILEWIRDRYAGRPVAGECSAAPP